MRTMVKAHTTRGECDGGVAYSILLRLVGDRCDGSPRRIQRTISWLPKR